MYSELDELCLLSTLTSGAGFFAGETHAEECDFLLATQENATRAPKAHERSWHELIASPRRTQTFLSEPDPLFGTISTRAAPMTRKR